MATAAPESFWLPPKYVEKISADPLALSFATKALGWKDVLRLVAWNGLNVGKFCPIVEPVTATLPDASTAMVGLLLVSPPPRNVA